MQVVVTIGITESQQDNAKLQLITIGIDYFMLTTASTRSFNDDGVQQKFQSINCIITMLLLCAFFFNVR